MKKNIQILIVAVFLLLLTLGYFYTKQNDHDSSPRIPAEVAGPSVARPAPAPTPAVTDAPTPAPTPMPDAIKVSKPSHKHKVITPNLDPVLTFEEPTTPSTTPAPAPAPAPIPTATQAPEPSHAQTVTTANPTPMLTFEDPTVTANTQEPKVSVNPAASAAAAPTPAANDDFGAAHIYGGLGLNYYQLSEDLNTSNATYRTLMTPSYHLGLDLDLTKKTAVELEYKDTSVHFNNSSVNLNSGDGHWQTLSLQISTVLDGFSNFLSRMFGDTLEFRLLFGFEAHRMPVTLFTISAQPEVKNLNLIDAAVGGQATYYFNPKTKLSVLERLQYPLVVGAEDAGASMSATPVIFFDGSIGVDRKVGKATWLGIYWFGQFNDMHFSYTDSQTNANGSMSSFFSTIEVRLTYDF